MRVVLADDSALLREGLARLLTEAGMEVVASVPDAETLLSAVAEHRPDVAVVDIRMPPTYEHEGARAAVVLKETDPDLGVLLLSQSLEARYVTDLVRRHPRALGYLLKDRVTDIGVLVDALHRVRAGGTVLDPDVVTHLLGRGDLASQLSRLTERETSVLRLMAEGLSNRAIGGSLHIDLRTVESHVSSIFTKLDLTVSTDENRRVRAVLAWLQR